MVSTGDTYVRIFELSSIIDIRDLNFTLRYVMVLVDVVGQEQGVCSGDQVAIF